MSLLLTLQRDFCVKEIVIVDGSVRSSLRLPFGHLLTQCPHHVNATRGKAMHAIHTTHTTKKQMQQLSYEYDEVCPSFTSTQFGFGYPTPHTLMTINLFTSRYASEGSFGRAFPHYLVAASLDKEKFRCKVASSVGCK